MEQTSEINTNYNYRKTKDYSKEGDDLGYVKSSWELVHHYQRNNRSYSSIPAWENVSKPIQKKYSELLAMNSIEDEKENKIICAMRIKEATTQFINDKTNKGVKENLETFLNQFEFKF